MSRQVTGALGGVPLRYLADWTDRIAAGELPSTPPERPSGIERNVVATVRDWASPTVYIHDLRSGCNGDPPLQGPCPGRGYAHHGGHAAVRAVTLLGRPGLVGQSGQR